MSTHPEEHSNGSWNRAWLRAEREFDRFIPESSLRGDDDELRRLRLVVAIQLLTLALTPAVAFVHWINGSSYEVYALAGALIGALALLIGVRSGISSTLAGHGLSTTMVLVVVVSAAPLGGIHSPLAVILITLPLIHTVVVRDWSSWLWCVVALVTIAVLDGLSEGSPRAAHEKSVVFGFVTVLMTAGGSLFESVQRRNVRALEAARGEAEAAVEAKGRFLANMSHEIRTPLNGVLGMLGLLREEPLTPHQHDYVRTAHSSGVALLDLINDVLDFSKIEAGKMPLEASTFDLRRLVTDVLEQVALPADQKGVELIVRYLPATPILVVGDPGRVRQILLNLVTNAVKFTDRGHVLVTVESSESSAEPDRLRLLVEDTGIGIEPEQQRRVFEQFRQVEAPGARPHTGTGLGLAIVRELTGLMGGLVGMTSTKGEGSAFWVELPLPESAASTEPSPNVAMGRRLLLVDGSEVTRRVLREQLEPWHLDLDEAASAERAVASMRRAADEGRPFDIAVVDLALLERDGVEWVRVLAEDRSLGRTRLVVLVSAARRSEISRLLDAGCVACLNKPVSPIDLLDMLTTRWDEPAAAPRASVAVSPEPAPSAQGKRFLVVEDNAVNQKVAARMLENLGAHVDVAGDGLEALMQIETFPYDLVFMDVQMPRMDGLEATRRIREREQAERVAPSRRLTIVAMTAYAQIEDRNRCLEAGMDGYIRKPITRPELLDALHEHLGIVESGVHRFPSEASTRRPRDAAAPPP